MKKSKYKVDKDTLSNGYCIRYRDSNDLLFTGSLTDCYAWIKLMENNWLTKNSEKLHKLDKLPASCCESAESLKKLRSYFEKDNIFPSAVIDFTIQKLRSYNDQGLSETLYGKEEEINKLVKKYIHVM